jgi:hypothetical protein
MFWLAEHLHQSPSEIVQALHEAAQQRAGAQDPIELYLGVGGWPGPKSLYFISDRILENDHEIDLQSAVGIALDFYLNLRMAAAFALRVRHFAETHGMAVDKAIEDWAFWEAGYLGLSDMDDHELSMIQNRIQELRILYNVGRQVLEAQEGKRRGAGRIRVPKSVLSMNPRPPERMGIRWGTGETPSGWDAKRLRVDAPRPGSFVTHLAAWLALLPNEIVERIARVAKGASPAGCAILGLDAPDMPKGPRSALIFERGSIFLAFIVDETIAHNSVVEVNKKKAAELIAEWKLRLRHAAVYAALVRDKAKRRRNPEFWIRLDALATFGFAEGRGVPDEAWGAIGEKESELFELYETGLFVLEACRRQPGPRQV